MHNDEYIKLINSLKQKIQAAQQREVLAANKELVILYREISNAILGKQQQYGWRAKIIDNLSRDLSQSFPELKDFSLRNLKYGRKFAETHPDLELVQQAAALIPWFHYFICARASCGDTVISNYLYWYPKN